jgi:hypothetical protein
MAKAIKVKDLRDQIGTDDTSLLYCPKCGAEYSANAGDYFMANPETVFKHCGVNMQLVTKHTSYRHAS